MTKMEMAEMLVSSPAWDGEKDAKTLCKMYSKEELHNWYTEIEQAEEDYYNERYN